MLRKGDKVFYTDNDMMAVPSSYFSTALQVIQDFGLVPLAYRGAGSSVKGSNLDKEIRDDFYQSKAVVLFLGKGQDRNIKDNWALPELEIALSRKIACFVYVTPEITEKELVSLGLPIDAAVIRDQDQFAITLRQNLERMMIAESL